MMKVMIIKQKLRNDIKNNNNTTCVVIKTIIEILK